MSFFLGQPARNLLDAPLLVPDGVEGLGRALWLYVRFLTLTNSRGLIIRKRDQLAQDLHVSEERIDAWLGRLSDTKLVEIQAPAPFLVIKLGMWSDSTPEASDSQASAYSYTGKLLHTKLKDSYRHEAETKDHSAKEDLLREILDTLGESDASSFEKAVELYSPQVIRAALQRVRRAQGIRKSRTALFRHLLPLIARESANES